MFSRGIRPAEAAHDFGVEFASRRGEIDIKTGHATLGCLLEYYTEWGGDKPGGGPGNVQV